MIKNFFLLVLVLSAITVQVAVADEKLDLSTHDSLIQKLESVLASHDTDTMFKQSQLALRLADLYAERARLLSLEKEGKGDVLYKTKIEADRKKSIQIYTQVLPSLKVQEKGRVLLQSAHLYILLQKQEEAVKIYQGILKNPSSYNREIVAVAQIQWGDIQFYKGEFEKALSLFQQSSLIKENTRKGYAFYRIAWCQYNLGKTQEAQIQMINLLKNKSLFLKTVKTDKEKSIIVDTAFQEEVSRDLATFMARNNIVESDITTLSQLSPESARQKNLVYLATELDRIAQKKSALMVWKVLGKQKIDFESQLEGQIQITRIQYDLGHKDKVLIEMDKSIALLKSPACGKSEECILGQQNLKKIITDWGKAEERSPSGFLIFGFGKYTAAFDDAEMSYWAGHASLKRKLYPEAFIAFKKASQLLTQIDRSKDSRSMRMFEGSLLGAIESAESSNDQSLKLASYRLYLELNPHGNKRDEIKYQIGHIFYENEDYLQAANLFREIAIDKLAPTSLREKSSELCLDSSVLLKNESQIESDTLLFSQTFKSRSAYFLGLWRKSILNQSAKIINNEASASEQLILQWKKLDQINFENWPARQKKNIIKNKLAIGFRLKNLEMVAKPSQQYLALSDITVEERNEALDHAAWVAEMRMDFPKAIQLLKQVSPNKNKVADHYFKLALLKELAHQDPSVEYTKFMSVSKDTEKNQYAAYQLVHFSPSPNKYFTKYTRLLKGNPVLYASAGVIAYEKSLDHSVARSVLTYGPSKSTFESQILARSMELKAFEQLQKTLLTISIAGKSDALVQKNLIKRIKLIKQLEKKSQAAIQKKDSSLQLILLAQVAYENSRLVQDIVGLPVPKQLNAAQKKYYQDQLQLQVKPYMTQAITVKEKVSELWETAIKQAIFKDLHDLSQELEKPGSRLAQAEIEKLKKAAELSGLKENPFINFTRERHKVAAEATKLEQSISEDPFNFNDIEKLKVLQKELGRGPMVAYLESRSREMKMGLQSRGGKN